MKKLSIIHTVPIAETAIKQTIKMYFKGVIDAEHFVFNNLLDAMGNSLNEAELQTHKAISDISKTSDNILISCSSLGEFVESYPLRENINLYRIDKPMIEQALKEGQNICVLYSNDLTLSPTKQLIENCKEFQNMPKFINIKKEIQSILELKSCTIEKTLNEKIKKYDTAILAQVSISYLLKKENIILNTQIFESIYSGLKQTI